MCVTFIAKAGMQGPFGVAFNQSEDPVTEEEIISIVDEAHEQGVIEEKRSRDDPEYHGVYGH